MSIDLKEAINIIERGDWVSIRVITADGRKATGGKVLEIPKARIARGQVLAKRDAPKSVIGSGTVTKNPNHNLNMTRNLELPNKQILKIHPTLVTHINQQAVL